MDVREEIARAAGKVLRHEMASLTEAADAVLARLDALGLAIVPKAPTDEMKRVGIAKDDELEWLQQDRAIPQIFTAMIEAASK